MHAAGPWTDPTIIPDNPKLICLVEVKHVRNQERKFFLVKNVSGRWIFADRSWLSTEWEVLRWAYVND